MHSRRTKSKYPLEFKTKITSKVSCSNAQLFTWTRPFVWVPSLFFFFCTQKVINSNFITAKKKPFKGQKSKSEVLWARLNYCGSILIQKKIFVWSSRRANKNRINLRSRWCCCSHLIFRYACANRRTFSLHIWIAFLPIIFYSHLDKLKKNCCWRTWRRINSFPSLNNPGEVETAGAVDRES